MSRKFFKSFVSIIMALAMIVSINPCVAIAANDNTTKVNKPYENDSTHKELPDGPKIEGNTWIINPDNAQYVLDGAYGSINGKTIHFSEGTYSELVLARPTKFSGSDTK